MASIDRVISPGQVYRHYKGKDYKIVTTAILTGIPADIDIEKIPPPAIIVPNLEGVELVIYTDGEKTWARPIEDFNAILPKEEMGAFYLRFELTTNPKFSIPRSDKARSIDLPGEGSKRLQAPGEL